MLNSAHSPQRRQILKHAALAGAAATAGLASAPASSQPQRRWRLVSRWPQSFPDQYVAAERLAQRITVMSQGELTVSVVGPNELGDYKETLSRVQSGSVEMCRSLTYDWRDRGFAFDIFTFVPLGMSEMERAVWLEHFGGQTLWDDLYADLGLKPFLCGSVGPQAFGWFAQPVRSVSDLQGLRYRTTGINTTIMEQLGAIPKVMGRDAIGPAVAAGELNAFEFVGPAVDVAYGLHEFLPVYVYPSFHQTTGSIELVINQAAWESLPIHLQQIIEVAAQAEYRANLAAVHASNTRALQTLVQRGIQLETLSDDILTALGNVTGDVLRDIRMQSSPQHRRIFDSFLEARTALLPWTSLTEGAFLAARQLPFNYVKAAG